MFLDSRTHQTKVNNNLSYIADLISGIVQGSGIGPVYFLILSMIWLLYSSNMVLKLNFLPTILNCICAVSYTHLTLPTNREV